MPKISEYPALGALDPAGRIPIVSGGATRSITADQIRSWIDVRDHDTLAGAVAYANSNAPIALLFKRGTYSWSGADRPIPGVSLIGEGFVFGGSETTGTIITGVVDQNTGQAYSTLMQGIYFQDGLRVRKQFTTMRAIAVAGEGLSLNKGAVGSAYYCTFDGVRVTADEGGSALTLGSAANANHGTVAVINVPIKGRGIEYQAGAGGNYIEVSIDIQTGDPTADPVASWVYDNGNNNKTFAFYTENRSHPAEYDGAKFVTGSAAIRPSFRVQQDGDSVFWNHSGLSGEIAGSYGTFRHSALTPVYITANDPPVIQMDHGSLAQVYLPKVKSWGQRTLTLDFYQNPQDITLICAKEFTAISAIATAGSGYSVDDLLTVAGGTSIANNMGGAAVIRVTAVDGGGGVTAAAIVRQGYYTTLPTNNVAVTGGGGTSATFTMTSVNESINFNYLSLVVVAPGTIRLRPRASSNNWILTPNADLVAKFIPLDATPSVNTTFRRMKTANTGATTITAFDSAVDGQEFEVIIGDSFTTIDASDNPSIVRVDGVNANYTPASGDIIRCYRRGTVTYVDLLDLTP
jgi:hypothetical protein